MKFTDKQVNELINSSIDAISKGFLNKESSLRGFLTLNGIESEKLDSRIKKARDKGKEHIKSYIVNDDFLHFEGKYSENVVKDHLDSFMFTEINNIANEFKNIYGGKLNSFSQNRQRENFFFKNIKYKIESKRPHTIINYDIGKKNLCEFITFRENTVLAAGKIDDWDGYRISIFGKEDLVINYIEQNYPSKLKCEINSSKSLDKVVNSNIVLMNDFLSTITVHQAPYYR